MIWDNIVKALSQPSTYAGFAGLAMAFGLSDSTYSTVTTALAAIFSAVAVILHEKTA